MCGDSTDNREKRGGALGSADATAEGPIAPPLLEVGEELSSMVCRTAGQGAEADGPAGGAAARGAPTMESCGWGAPEKRKQRNSEGDGHRKGEGRAPSPQDSCSVADGILHHTKKQRLLRRRVTFSTQSRMRLIARVSHLFADDEEGGGDGDGVCGDAEGAIEDEEMGEPGGGAGSPGDGEEMGGDEGVVVSGVAAAAEEGEATPEGCERERSASPCDSTKAAGSDGDKTPCGSEFGGEEDGEEAAVEGEGQGDGVMTWEEEVALTGGDQGDEPVETKTNDGPSLTNVMTQALIIGLVERQVRNVGDVLRTLRESVAPGCHEAAPCEARRACGAGGNARSPSSTPPSSDDDASDDAEAENRPPKKRSAARRPALRSSMVLDDEVFGRTNEHIQVLLGRIVNNGRASLLPSTAQIGPPFVPALEFLLQSMKEAQARNDEDRRRLQREKHV